MRIHNIIKYKILIWGCSSAVERALYMRKVRGSRPEAAVILYINNYFMKTKNYINIKNSNNVQTNNSDNNNNNNNNKINR